jgi:drug/metabolite transporter (DMT)-like permease
MKTDNIKNISVYILLCLIWGSTWLAIRASLESLTPFVSAGFRFILASFIILTFMKIQGLKIITDKKSLLLFIYMAFFTFIVGFGLVYWAEQFVPSGLAAVLFAVYPFFVALLSHLAFPTEKIGSLKLLGMILGFSGIVIIFSDNFSGDLSTYFLGMAAIILSSFMQSTVVIAVKKYGGHINSLSINFIPMLIAGCILLCLGLLIEDTSTLIFDWNAVVSVGYLSFFGSLITFTSYYWLLKRINIVILSLIAFITPIIAVFLGWLVYDELLTIQHLIGSMLVLTGLLTANLSYSKKLSRTELLNKKTKSN